MKDINLYHQCYGCWFAKKTRCECSDCPECGEDRGVVMDYCPEDGPSYDHECKVA